MRKRRRRSVGRVQNDLDTKGAVLCPFCHQRIAGAHNVMLVGYQMVHSECYPLPRVWASRHGRAVGRPFIVVVRF